MYHKPPSLVANGVVFAESVGYEVCCRREKGEPVRLVDSVMCGQCGGGHGDYYGGFPDGAADCRDKMCIRDSGYYSLVFVE